MPFAFADFRLDDETRQLWKAGREVRLAPKAFELLDLLVRSQPRALSRTSLLAALWPDAHVGATSLHVLVSQLRSALGDDPEAPRFIRTIHAFGYAFLGDAAAEPAAAEPAAAEPPRAGHARLTLDAWEWDLEEGENILGRDPKARVRIAKAGISRRHALITVRGGRAVIEDLGSKNGTSVEGTSLDSPRPLRDGDQIALGRFARFVFRLEEKDVTKTETESD